MAAEYSFEQYEGLNFSTGTPFLTVKTLDF